jgi:hypothetical protein
MMVVMCQAGGDRYHHNRSCRLRGWGDNGLQSQSLPGSIEPWHPLCIVGWGIGHGEFWEQILSALSVCQP